MSVHKSYEEINNKIKKGTVVVVTAEEVIDIAKTEGVAAAAKKIDVVTTGTFGMMCSSGAFLNFGHTKPKMRMSGVTLNDVPAYAGVAAVDAYIGATEVAIGDSLNKKRPGEFRYGGAHVIEDLVCGKEIRLQAVSYGTDCYPLRKLERTFTLAELRDAILFNPRNCYQNYNVGINTTDRTIYTYMGVLQPNMANANFSSAGQLSPLLNDPYFRSIGIGSRIFLGGGVGYVAFPGTQHDPDPARNALGVPTGGSGTMAVIGDLKMMSPRYLRGASITGYGVSLAVGIGVPIPVLDEEMLRFTTISDRDIQAPVVDYGEAYPNALPGELGFVTYAELRSGEITFQGRKIRTASLSSYKAAREIAGTLKKWIADGSFTLGEPVTTLPSVRR